VHHPPLVGNDPHRRLRGGGAGGRCAGVAHQRGGDRAIVRGATLALYIRGKGGAVANEVGQRRYAAPVQSKEMVNVVPAQLLPYPVASEERRIADNYVSFRPLRFYGVALLIMRENSVHLRDCVKGFEDRLRGLPEAVVP
jgi:hypothetical protein